jgi:hypothetical protein
MPGKKPQGASDGQRGRSVITGRFVNQSTVRRHPDATVNESTRRGKGKRSK